MTFWVGKKVLREDRWFKYYELEQGVSGRVSKFSTSEVRISARDLAREWMAWDSNEQLEFAQAFRSKKELTSEDEAILDILMRSNDDQVLSSIAICLTRLSRKANVLPFLISQLGRSSEPKANFLQALGLLKNRSAIPDIKHLHDRLATDIMRSGAKLDNYTVLDFFASCVALDRLSGNNAYRDEIARFLTHPNESIAAMAKLWFDGGPPSK